MKSERSILNWVPKFFKENEKKMSLVETYGPYLPYLRRFARALTGSQSSGDTYVRTALAALAAGEAEIDSSLSPKIALYNMFLGIWSSTGAKLEDSGAEGGAL